MVMVSGTRKHFLLALLLMALSAWSFAEESKAAVYRFLMQGGDLRMKTMRILQEYAMVGTNNHFKNPDKSLARDMRELGEGLDQLIASAKIEEEKEDFSVKALAQAKEKLETAQEILKEKPTEKNAMKFWQAIDGVREGLNRSLVHLSQMVYPDDEIVQGIMYANRLSTIAQRFGALYLYKVWGFNELHADKQLAFLNTFFPESIENVKESAEELPDAQRKAVEAELKKVKQSLGFFTIMGKSSRRFIPTLIYTKAQKIAQSAGVIAELFMKQAPSS